MKLYLPLKLKVFLDDITAVMEGRNKELPGIGENVLEDQCHCALQSLGGQVPGMQQKRRSRLLQTVWRHKELI